MSEMTQKNRRRISFQNGLSIYFFKRKEKKHKVPTLKKIIAIHDKSVTCLNY